jgi:hypothetical protein
MHRAPFIRVLLANEWETTTLKRPGHPERSLARSLRKTESKDLHLHFVGNAENFKDGIQIWWLRELAMA